MRAEVRAAPAAEQQARVDDWLARHPNAGRLVVVENMLGPLALPPDVPLVRLAAGCPCCSAQVLLRVALTRAVRSRRPDELLLLLAGADHLPRVRAVLADGSLGVRFDVE
jgi:hypothetical protein